MILSDTAIKKPILTLVGLIVLMMFGFLAVRTMGIDTLPNVTIPYVTVTVTYPGASPEEIETSVVKPIEDAVVQVDGLKHMTATCANNFCQVLLEFELGRDQNVAASDVREKVSAIEGDLPDGADKPQILKYDMNAIPVVTVVLTGNYGVDELYDYADQNLSDRFSAVSGVASVDLVGGEEREVVVSVDREKLSAAGLTLAEVVNKVGKGNVKVPSGQISDHTREFSITYDAEAATPARLGEIELGSPRGNRVYLRDVATFSFGTQRPESYAFSDGKPAIVVKITKRGEANAAKTVEGIRAAFDLARQNLPGGMRLGWIRDEGAYVHETVAGGVSSIWQGVLLTGLVLLLFLSDWRTALTAFVSIPITIVISLIAFTLYGYTANVITMNAIGISVGILVANSIVVLENIVAKPGNVMKATDEIALAVAASALTNVVVFLPIATMKTMAGRFFVPFAIVVTASTFASLLVSFTLTPLMAQALDGKGAGFNRLLARLFAPWNAFYERLARGYAASLGVVLRRPKLWLALFSVLTLAGFALLSPYVKSDFVPTMDRGELSITLEFPADTNLDHASRRAQAIAAEFEKMTDSAGKPLVVHRVVTVGRTQGTLGQVSRGSYLAEIDLVLTDMTRRPDTIDAIASRIRTHLLSEPDVIATVMVPSVVGGSSQTLQLKILGEDMDTLNTLGLAAARKLKADPSATDVSHNVRPGRPEIRIHPNRAVLNDLGLTPDILGLNLRAAFAGLTPATFTQGERSYDIRVRYAQKDGVGQIDELNFPGPGGRPFVLGAVADVKETIQPVQIVRSEKRRSTIVYANNAPGHGLGETMAVATSALADKLPRGYATLFGGMSEYMQEALDEFGLVTAIAIALTYLLLAAILESWVLPFVILFTVPFSYLGIFAAIAVTGTTLSIFGLLAGIMLVGVVVNAAILLIDAWQRTGDVLQSAKMKFRPILMSCAAALFGMLPMALGTGLGCELRQSMGIGSVGGILVSSLVSLYFIPALCALKKQPVRR